MAGPARAVRPWKTVYTRFWRWSHDGTLTALVAKVRVIAEAIDELDREVSVDSSIVRAHQHAAGARTTVPPRRTQGRPGPATDPPNQMITLSDGPAADPPPRSTSPATDTAAHCRCC